MCHVKDRLYLSCCCGVMIMGRCVNCFKTGLSLLISMILVAACSGSDTASASTPLLISGQPSTSITLGSTYYFNANTSGGSGTVGFSIKNKPYWATLNTVTGELRGTPDKAGTFSNIIISASDGYSTTSLPGFTVSVYDSNKVAVTITWAAPGSNTDGTTFDNPAGFVIHYGTSSGNLNQSVTIGSSAARSYNLTGLSKGSTYYFSVAAINTLKIEGVRSAVTSIVL